MSDSCTIKGRLRQGCHLTATLALLAGHFLSYRGTIPAPVEVQQVLELYGKITSDGTLPWL